MTRTIVHRRLRSQLAQLVRRRLGGWLLIATAWASGQWIMSAAYAEAPTLLKWDYGNGGDGGPKLNEPIVTDRPDFTEASSTVGRGVFQIESGYTFVFNDDGAERTETHSFPETLFRLGVLADWLELRVAWNYLVEDVDSNHTTGPDDLYVGTKLGLTGQEGILPEIALMPQARVPTGSDAFTANEMLPGVNTLYGWDVTDVISMGGSTQFNRRVDGESLAAYTEWAQSWTVNYTITETVGAYTEWFGLFPHSADTERAQDYFDGGFTYRPTDDVQLDIRAGVGLNESADDYFVGTGLSMRFQ